MQDRIMASFYRKARVYTNFLERQQNIETIHSMAAIIAHCLRSGNKVLVCGNGGSAADAMHFAAEFTGRFKQDRSPYPVLALGDAPYLTAVSNDFGYASVFERQVEAFGKPDDVLICLSTSGMSGNVRLACRAANRLGMDTLSLVGKRGGELVRDSKMSLWVDSPDTDVIQEIHMSVLHTIVEVVEKELE